MVFSRNTIIKLVESLPFQYHAEVDQFALEFALEDVIMGSSIKEKKTSLMRYLIKNPQVTSPDGIPLAQAIIGHLISKYGGSSEPSERFPELVYSLDRDGYTLDRNGFGEKPIKTIEKVGRLSEEKNKTNVIDHQEGINKAQLKVFLCHAKEDKQAVREQYARLKNDGFVPWIDEENLLPGQNWDLEVRKAVRETDVVLVFLSKNSVTKTGYVQKEIRLAIDVAEEQPEGTIFIIPVRLENCEVPDRLKELHWVDLFNKNGYPRLILALKRRESELYPPPPNEEERPNATAQFLAKLAEHGKGIYLRNFLEKIRHDFYFTLWDPADPWEDIDDYLSLLKEKGLIEIDGKNFISIKHNGLKYIQKHKI